MCVYIDFSMQVVASVHIAKGDVKVASWLLIQKTVAPFFLQWLLTDSLGAFDFKFSLFRMGFQKVVSVAATYCNFATLLH